MVHFISVFGLTVLYSISSLLTGALLGFVISIPMTGPIGVYITGKGISGQTKQGFLAAAGCALVETAYCFIATMWSESIIPETPYKEMIVFSGSILVLYLGISGFRAHAVPEEQKIEKSVIANFGDFFVGVAVTMLNPGVILTWVAVVAIVNNFGIEFTQLNSILFSAGVLTGALAWFGLYLATLKKAKRAFKIRYLDIALKVLSILLVAIGAFLFCTTVGTVFTTLFS